MVSEPRETTQVEWQAFYAGQLEPIQHTFSDDAWRKLYAGLAISPTLVQAYGSTPYILAQRAWDIGDAMLAEGKRREAVAGWKRETETERDSRVNDIPGP